MSSEINWGYNCLTQGVHHGRPEAIWNIPLWQAATKMFSRDELQTLVITRIYNDAMQFVKKDAEFVEQGARESVFYSQEWAERVKKAAEKKYLHTLQHKIGEISQYYESVNWKNDVQGVLERLEADKLNPGYAPMHPHDTINMLCRIIGVSSSIAASK